MTSSINNPFFPLIKKEVTDLMGKAVALRHAHPEDYDRKYKELQEALYPLVEFRYTQEP